MRISGRTLDDLLWKLFPKLLSSTVRISPSRGPARELFGVLLEIGDPRARLSRTESRGKPFSCLGEFLWYLSRDNRLEFIRYYISAYDNETEDGETVYGGYGPRLFRQRGNDQIQNIISSLRANLESRRAVIQIFNAEDIAKRHKEVPCTCTLQFVVRCNKLHMLTNMRSNDAYLGLPHDVFCFTMLQEVIARSLGVEVGTYKHSVGSLHIYDDDIALVQQYLEEGVQSTVSIPAMPLGDPWPSIRKVLEAEERIRHGEALSADNLEIDAYWADLVRLLQIFAATGNPQEIESLKSQMSFKRFAPYIESRKSMRPRDTKLIQQMRLPL